MDTWSTTPCRRLGRRERPDVHSGRCAAFWPWRQLLQRRPGQHVRDAVAAHGPQVARIVPELDSVPAPPPVDPEERFRAFAGFGRLLADAAGPGRKA